jgi:putative flippase GtrA
VPQSVSEQSAGAPPSPGRLRTWLAVLARQMGWFTGIGVVMTIAYLALYAALRLVMGAQAANVVSWVVTAVADTSANRRFTFGVLGRAGAVRAQLEGLMVFGLGLAITSGSLYALDAAVAEPGRVLELGVLAAANLAAGLLRFVLLRWWVFAPGR